MVKTLFLLFSLAVNISCFAAKPQTILNVTSIPDSLKKNAYAVVRYDHSIYEYNTATDGLEKHSIAITILDKKGESSSVFNYSGDRFRSLSSFSAKMYDANGNVLKKYSLSDVNSSEWSSSLATDARHYYFSCDPPYFPFTIVYEYEVKWNDGVLTFPPFIPQDNYNLSVEKASYQLILPEGLTYKSKAINLPFLPTETTLKGTTIHEWRVENLLAIEQEYFDANLMSYIPILFISPQSFIYDKVPGTITDWESYGKWVYSLIEGRDILLDATKSTLIEMTKNAKTDREKVKILYDYLGETTHYVSIQLGIGGFQPMLAAEVCKTRFGDCKGLTNYMKAMLSAIGITSNYCVIRLDPNQKTLFSDYANFYQLNHVCLQVPLSNDTLWLECTNPRTPFGFIHNGISGHDVLVCNEKGGIIQHVPDYPDSLNIEKHTVVLEVSPDGSANAKVKQQYFVKIYDYNSGFPFATASEQADNLRNDINLPNVTMGPFQFKEDKSPLPCLTIENTWSTAQYGTKTGNRLFIPINPIRSTYENIKKAKRKHDLTINRGYKDIDSICIRIPEGYEIESMPGTFRLSSPFGTIESNIKALGKEITIEQNVFVSSGTYKVSSYPEFIGFFEKIRSAYKGIIILRKKAL